MAAGAIGVQVLDNLTRNALVSDVGALADDLGTQFTLQLWPLAAGVLVAFVAEVFASSSLRADVEGMV